jgi:hypothetical protein
MHKIEAPFVELDMQVHHWKATKKMSKINPDREAIKLVHVGKKVSTATEDVSRTLVIEGEIFIDQN